MTKIGECSLVTGYLEKIIVSKRNRHFSTVDGILLSKDRTVLIQAPNIIDRSRFRTYSIPDTVTTIGKGAMYDCPICSIRLPDSVKTIEAHAFQYSLIRSITIPSSVEHIERYAFYGVDKLKAVRIEGAWTMIEDHAFDGNRSLDAAWVSSKAKLGKKVFAKNCEVIRW